MDGWQQDWWKMLDSVVEGVEQFFQDMSRDMNEAAEALLDFSEELADQIEAAVSPGLDQFDQQIGEWMEPVLQAILGFESSIDRAVEPVTHTVEPWLNQHPVCIGCRHYHGQSYGGNLLVCAMHPYGIVDGADSCPDKEAFTWGIPSIHSEDDHL